MGFLNSFRTIGQYQYVIIIITLLQLFIANTCDHGVLFSVPNLDFHCEDIYLTNSSERLFGNQCTLLGDGFNGIYRSSNNNSTASLPCQNITYDHSLFVYTATEKYGLICERKWLTTLAGTSYIVGYFLGGLLSGILCDRFGRKRLMLLACVVGISSHLIAIFAPYFAIYLVARCLFGMVELFIWLPLLTLQTELVRQEQRIVISSIDNFNRDVAVILLAAVNFVLSDFILIHYLVIAVQATVLILIFIFIRESPKWLVVQKRQDEAERVVQEIAHFNKLPVKSLEHLLHPEIVTKRANLSDLLRTPVTRKRTLIFVIIWQSVAFLFYGILYNMGEFSNNIRLSVIIMAAIEIPSAIPTMISADKLGRQVTFFTLVLACGLSCTVMAGFQKGSIALMILAIIGKALISCAFSLLYLYTGEIFSTQTRNTGLGFCVTLARISSFLSPQVRLLNIFWSKSCVVLLGSMSIVAALCIPALPDTTGYELPATLENGEAFQAGHRYSLRLARKRSKNIDTDKTEHEEDIQLNLQVT